MKPFFTRTRCVVGVLLVFLLPLTALAQAPANDLCSNATFIQSGSACVNTTSSLMNGTNPATATAGINPFCGAAANPDVWYVFTAQTTTPTITLSGMGALMAANRRLQIFSTSSCTVATLNANSLMCTNAANFITPTVVPGQTYLIRVFSGIAVAGTQAQWQYSICITDPATAPTNNACGTPTVLTSSTTCTNTWGTLLNSTSTGSINAFCGNAGSPDVWYSFVANSQYPVITLSNMGTGIDNSPRIQLFTSASCTAANLNTNSLGCASGTNVTTLSLDVADDVGGVGLTIGTTYFVRIYTNGAVAATGSPSDQWSYNICVTDPVAPVPANDNCSGAIQLQVVASCGQFQLNGTVSGSTLSTGFTSGCAAGTYDVWYKFIAVDNDETITLGGAANNFTNRRLELFSGSCAGLTSIGCNPSTITSATLIPGNTYYVRVYSTAAGLPPNANADFNICVTTPAATIPPRFGNSYVNITKKTTGGVVETGDILEIRMTINYTGNATLFKARYVDNIPTNTAMLSSPTDFIRVITNEGLPFRTYTSTANTNDDAATYKTAPGVGEFNIKMNLGFSNAPGNVAVNNIADVTGATDIVSTDRPRGGNGVIFATSFRVQVTGTPGQVITLGQGKFIYRTTSGGADIILNATPFQILISDPLTLCTSAIGLNIAQESGGTFDHGSTVNRPNDLITPIAGYSFVQQTSAQSIGDGMYGVVKNMSPVNGTLRTADRKPTCPGASAPNQNCSSRMFGGFWDVDGDHTGTANAIGNVPPVAGTDAGYMLVVNADFITTEVYTQSLTGLCPGTYYEFSAWMRNICPVCGLDSTASPKYNVGVYPNLTFALDGFDRYSTGEIDATGWQKKGFVFLTGPAQTTASFSIRNNSQGGGGNDWAMDDIAVATCLPNMKYNPSNNPTVCLLNASNIADTIRSFFNNYVYYKWQRSVDGGATFTDVSIVHGPATPTFNASLGLWEYWTNFMVPPAWATLANTGDIYRAVAATTPGNLGSTNCVVTNGINFVTMNVLNCGTPLKTDLLSFNGKLSGDKGVLSWTTSREEDPLMYFIQRSSDGINFKTVGSLSSHNSPSSITNQYTFTDPTAVDGKVYYRLEMAAQTNNKKYSRIIDLSLYSSNKFGLAGVVNPFNQVLDFSINSPEDAKIDADLVDMFGKVVKRKTFVIHNGLSLLSFTDTQALPTGTYVLRIQNNGQVFTEKVMKRN
jgi:hypothetical protein